MPLRRRAGDQLDLPVVQPEPFVCLPTLRFDRPVVGQQYALRAAFDDRGRDAAFRDVGEALGREQHRDILLAERLEPFADAGGEQRIVEQAPRSEEHTSELQSLMRISYAVFCLQKKKTNTNTYKTK